MPSVIRFAAALVAVGAAGAAGLPYYSVLSGDAGEWPAILSSIGLQRQPAAVSRIVVARPGAAASADWNARVENGAILILEGESALAGMFGFRRGTGNVRVNSITDVHRPSLRIVWEKALDLPRTDVPKEAQIFARERWGGEPLVAGFRRGAGAVLWVAASPADCFPYVLAALCDLGLEPPFRSFRLWAFFDSAYRSRVDLDFFAERWRKSGISALHVAAWHFYDSDPKQDAYLAKLIEACHRQGILVYAWLELPHVSEKFWADHPAWREKTATLQDAQLDWRKLMNLANRDCFRAVSAGVRRLLGAFDWDGVNLAELYFESLQGTANLARFTPLNDQIRAEFRSIRGIDPLEILTSKPERTAEFLEYRADLARRIQEEWLGELAKTKLDIVLTHVDDRFDPHVRDAIGTDAARVLPLLDKHSFTFLIEDPATVWHLGPQRYETIADTYRALTPRHDRLAIDLNIVDRYQNVYPTKQQTGIELLQLLHRAAASFARTAVYFESSLLAPDLPLISSASANATRIEQLGTKTLVESPNGVGLPWQGGALVDGIPWPILDTDTLWLPAGAHVIESAALGTGPRVLRFNGTIRSARIRDALTIEFSYESASRAIAVLNGEPRLVEIDGVATSPSTVLMLPQGQHVVLVTAP
jgi:hypothetical protein